MNKFQLKMNLAVLAFVSCAMIGAPAMANDKEGYEDVDVCEWSDDKKEWDEKDVFYEELDTFLFETAAYLLEVEFDDLVEMVSAGKTLADVAAGYGVDTSLILDTALAKAEELLLDMVAKGDLEAEDVEPILVELKQDMTFELTFASLDPFAWLADTLYLTQDEFWTLLKEDGKSIADVIESKGQNPEWIVEQFLALSVEEDKKLVEAGFMDEDEAKLKAEIDAAFVPAYVTLSSEALFMSLGFYDDDLDEDYDECEEDEDEEEVEEKDKDEKESRPEDLEKA